MKTSQSKIAPPSGVGGLITPFQIKRIRKLCKFNEDAKCEVVYAHTGQTSLKAITQVQAVEIILSLSDSKLINDSIGVVEYRAAFDKNNPRHKMILSLCRQANWTATHEKYGEVADLERLNYWLNSAKCPVQKPLKKMDEAELRKIISALTGIVRTIYK